MGRVMKSTILPLLVALPLLGASAHLELRREVFCATIDIAPSEWTKSADEELDSRLKAISLELRAKGFTVETSNPNGGETVFLAKQSTREGFPITRDRSASIEIREITLSELRAYRLTMSATYEPGIAKHPWAGANSIAREMTATQQSIVQALLD